MKALAAPHVAALTVAVILVAGCSKLAQQNIDPAAPALFEQGEGLILGSVTAPSERYDYHETLRFHYRSVGAGARTTGFVTSAKSDGARYSQWGIPTCDKEGLTEQCGRLFAVSLPVGDYEIHAVQEVDPPSTIFEMPPLRFTVAQGRARYLGNMHVTLCQGLVRSTRGAVLGGHLAILDESQRDLALLEAQYPQLKEADVETQLLPNLGWRWRVPWEPYDWGTCESGVDSAAAAAAAAASEEDVRRNNVYFEIVGSDGFVSTNYERLLSDRLGLRLGYGTWESQGNMGFGGGERVTAVPIMLNSLVGTGRRRFELGGGVVVGSSESTGFQTLMGTVGLRSHTGERWLIRAGITPFYGLNDESSSYPQKGFDATFGLSAGFRF